MNFIKIFRLDDGKINVLKIPSDVNFIKYEEVFFVKIIYFFRH